MIAVYQYSWPHMTSKLTSDFNQLSCCTLSTNNDFLVKQWLTLWEGVLCEAKDKRHKQRDWNGQFIIRYGIIGNKTQQGCNWWVIFPWQIGSMAGG